MRYALASISNGGSSPARRYILLMRLILVLSPSKPSRSRPSCRRAVITHGQDRSQGTFAAHRQLQILRIPLRSQASLHNETVLMLGRSSFFNAKVPSQDSSHEMTIHSCLRIPIRDASTSSALHVLCPPPIHAVRLSALPPGFDTDSGRIWEASRKTPMHPLRQ
jgi:hypothetical protein